MIYKIYLSESKAYLEVGFTGLKNNKYGAAILCPEKGTFLQLDELDVEELIKALNIVKNEIRERNEQRS
jgi:hypothetical protein